jgi:hypothetical protein
VSSMGMTFQLTLLQRIVVVELVRNLVEVVVLQRTSGRVLLSLVFSMQVVRQEQLLSATGVVECKRWAEQTLYQLYGN